MKVQFEVVKKEGISNRTKKPYCMYILRSSFGDIVLNPYKDKAAAVIVYMYDQFHKSDGKEEKR